MKLIEKLIERLENDYTELTKKILKMKKVDLLNNAYALAHYNEVVDVICDCVDINDPPFDKNTCKKALAYKGNLIECVYNSWRNYNHSEYYNFFTYEGLIDICKYAFTRG